MIKWSTLLKLVLVVVTLYSISYMLRYNRTTRKPEELATLIVGTNSEYPPYSFISDNEIVGVDIDIIREVAKRLGKEIELRDMAFTALLPQLQSGRIHVIAAGMTYNEQRAQHVLFTKPHLTGDPLLILSLKKGSEVTCIDDLVGKNVVVNEGFTADTYVSDLQGVSVTRLNTVVDALMTLKAGQAGAFVSAESAIKEVLVKEKDLFNTCVIPKTTEEYRLAVSRQYPELQERINSILTQMEEDGTLTDLKKKWGLHDRL